MNKLLNNISNFLKDGAIKIAMLSYPSYLLVIIILIIGLCLSGLITSIKEICKDCIDERYTFSRTSYRKVKAEYIKSELNS